MKRFLPVLFLICALGARAADTFIQMTNWNTDISAGANRDVFVKPLLYSNNFPVSPIDTRKYTSDSTSAFYISNQLSGYYQLDIQAPPQTRRLWLRVKDVSGKWTPTLLDFDFQNLSVPPNAYTRDQTDAAIRNAMNGLSGGSYTNSAMLWVDRNGGVGIRGVQGSPYATLSNALAAALAGDTIIVNAGRYTNNNLLKAGVNWYFAPGATVWYQQQTTNDAGWGLFDDRTSGPTTNYITGYGVFNFLGVTNGTSTDGAYAWNPNTRGAIVITNSATELHFQSRAITISGFASANILAGISILNCRESWFDVDLITDPLAGFTLMTPDTDDVPQPQQAQSIGIYWELGQTHVNCRRIESIALYAIWGEEPGTAEQASDFYFNGQFLGGKIYVACHSDNYRDWFTYNEQITATPLAFYGSGKHYVNAQKIAALGGNALEVASISPKSNTIVWLTCEKLTATGSWITAVNSGSTVFANVQHYEDVSNTIANGFVTVANTEFHLNGGYAKLRGRGINHAGGTVFLDGVTIDTSANTNPAITVASSGLSLKNTRLIAPSATNSISAASAQTVEVWTASSGNRPVNANVTLSPNAGFEVDTTGQMTVVAAEATHATNADNVTLATRATIATNTIGPLAYDSSTGAYTNGAGTTVLSAGLVNGSAVSGTVTLAATALAVDGSGITGTLLGSSVGPITSAAGPMLTTNANKIAPTWNANGLTNLNAANLTGTIADARLSGNVALLNAANTFTASNHIPGAFEGSGTSLTNLNASQLATGTIPSARSFALTGDVTRSAGSAATTLVNIPAISGANLTSLTGANVTGTLPQTTYPVALTNWDSRIVTATNNWGWSNQVGVVGVLIGTNGTIKSSGGITASGGFLKNFVSGDFVVDSGSGSSGFRLQQRNDTIGSINCISGNNTALFAADTSSFGVPVWLRIGSDGAGGANNLTGGGLASFTPGTITISNKLAVVAGFQTNVAGFNFFPNNPGNWVTALSTRTTNGVRRATLEVDISFVDAVGATPRVQFAIEQGTVITNTWQHGVPGGISSTVTNHFSFRLTTNAVVNITDISIGAGASVAISQSQLTSE